MNPIRFQRIPFRFAVLPAFFWVAWIAQGENYGWNNPNGDGVFSDPASWRNLTTMQNNTGPPGAGDTADIGDGAITITVDGGAVATLLNGDSTQPKLNVTAAFHAGVLSGSPLITGSALFSAGDVVNLGAYVSGGNFTADAYHATDLGAMNGATMEIKSGLTGVAGALSDGSMLKVDDTVHDFNVSLQSGAQLTVPNFINGAHISATLDGANTLLSTPGKVEMDGGFLDLTACAALTADELRMADGLYQVTGAIVSSGGHWNDSGTKVNVNQLFIGDNAGGRLNPLGSSIALNNGSQLFTSNGATIGETGHGSMTLNGTGTLWQVGGAGLALGRENVKGTLEIQNKAQVVFDDAASVFGVGLEKGGTGTVEVTDAGSLLDARAIFISIGKEAGSTGSLRVGNGAAATIHLHDNPDADPDEVPNRFDVGQEGTGTLTIDTGGQVQVVSLGHSPDSMFSRFAIGDAAGSHGSVFVTGAGSTLDTGDVTIIGVDGTGSMSISAGAAVTSEILDLGGTTSDDLEPDRTFVKGTGTVTLNGAGSLLTVKELMRVGDAGHGELTIGNAASAAIAGNFTVAAKRASGHVGTGFVHLNSGGQLTAGTTNDNNVSIAHDKGTVGRVFVADSGSKLNLVGNTIVGDQGDGLIQVSKGAAVQGGIVAVANATGSIGTILLTDNGTTMDCQQLALGELFMTQSGGGSALVTVEDGALLRVSNFFDLARNSIVDLGILTGNTGRVFVGTDNFGPNGTLRVGKNGILRGKKTKVTGNVEIGLGGKFFPGGDPGSFSVEGDLTMDAGSETDIELGGTSPGHTYDQLTVTGTTVLSGTLNVTLVNGFNPTDRESFKIVTGPHVSGTFDSVVGASVTYGPKGITIKPTITPSTLTVDVNPAGPPAEGAVSAGFPGQSTRNLGFTYKVTATPAQGFAFNGWTGDVTSGDAALTFVMVPNMALHANFAVNAFAPVVGAFAGLGTNSGGAGNLPAGLLNLALQPSGKFTAKFLLGGKPYPFTGTFLGAGSFSKQFTVAGKTLAVQLNVDLNGSDKITGSIGVDGVAYTVNADRSTFNARTNPATAFAGAYTVVFPPNADNSDANAPRPQGDGWATVSVSVAGHVSVHGALADHTPLTAAGSLAKDGGFSLLASLYHNGGVFAGVLTFAAAPRDSSEAVSDVTGTCEWSKPAEATPGAVFPQAFDTTLGANGSFYTAPPKNQRVLPGLDANGDAQLQFNGGHLAVALTKDITISLQNVMAYSHPTSSADKLTLVFTGKTGAFSGKFYDGTKLVPFTGVVLQKQMLGHGFFLGTSDSGTVGLSP